MLGDLLEVIKIIQIKLEDQLCKIHLQYILDKNGYIKATFNIGLFCYLRYEISKHVLGLIASYIKEVNAIIVLSQYTGVFSKTFSLPGKYPIQESDQNLDQPL